jgi:hypothetical protein
VNGGRSPRRKGDRSERVPVALLQASALAAERVPLSGAARGRFSGDISLPLLGTDRTIEVKIHRHGFGALYRCLDGAGRVVLRADRRQPLVVLPLRLAIEIAATAERRRSA